MGTLIIIGLRLLVPPLILRFPLTGGLAALALDYWKNPLMDMIGGGQFFFANYHSLDKLLDIYYLSFEMIVALRWSEARLRGTAGTLYFMRLVGVVLFEVTRLRWLLVVFPNVFELFFLSIVAFKRWLPEAVPRTGPQVAWLVGIVALPKLAQEYILHIRYEGWDWFINKLFK